MSHTPLDAPACQRPAPGAPQLAQPGKTCRIKFSFSIFFDGTRNNREYDMADGSFSNVVRLHDAFEEKPNKGVYRVYVPGVGTPFKEIGEIPAHKDGASMGKMGAERIRYAFLSIANRISFKLARNFIVPENVERIRAAVSSDHLARWARQLTYMLTASTNPKVDEIIFDVFGFSRGATAARSFLTQLNQYFCTGGDIFCGIPMRIRFVGLFDTVASVGYADSFPGPVEGHQDWGDETLLPIPKVDNCVHMVAAHEARNSFPVDLIRKQKGGYPANCIEIVYPGVHSDVGGGYAQVYQGKGSRAEGRLSQGPGDKLSQIPLNDMYRRAVVAGVPLSDAEGLARRGLSNHFAISEATRASFNAYVRLTHPECSGKQVETHFLVHRKYYLGWRKRVLAKATFDNLPFVRQSSEQERVDLIAANDELRRQVAAFAAHEKTLADFQQRLRSPSARDPMPPSAPTAFEFRNDWAQSPTISGDIAHFFEHYVHDSRAHFLLTDPQSDYDHKVIQDRLESKDRKYQQDKARYDKMYKERELAYLIHGEQSGITATNIAPLQPKPRDPLSKKERENLQIYRSGRRPIYNDDNPASASDGTFDLVDVVAAVSRRRERAWSYLHKRQIFAYARVKY